MKKILVIEDDLRIVSALAIRLRNAGYEPLTAQDAVQGTYSALKHLPNLIVLDIGLPGGDGFDLAAKFRRLDQTRAVPLVFLTASKDPRLRAKAMDLNAAGFLEKPYDGEELIATIRFALGETCTISASASRVRQPPPQQMQQKKILIIEDDPQAAMALDLRMRQAGYESTAAGDAVSGVQAAVRLQPDLVLMDITMPAGDGFIVAERIRKLVPAPVPFIFITGSRAPGLRARAEELGAAGFFEKPYDSKNLLATVERTLSVAPASTDAALSLCS